MTMEDAWVILLKHDYKRTKNREILLRFFDQVDRYVTAMDVRNAVEQDNPGISFDTIYRNLAVFSKLGILEETELNGERLFRMQCSSDGHHHHFICTTCGKTKSIPSCPMDSVTVNLSDYEIKGHKFEIYGRCPMCIEE
ncbi:Fur family transcriptional regulator [Sporosarcina obsidiansis]|uniref:Fur family transcriptional regulator n=1 Tax=Sporosarcina obsidiansis TaxID=2660748 RepID=UPI00129BB49F|nr:Fur family transcriptional regulator [Sporosarcina obsidiansis]